MAHHPQTSAVSAESSAPTPALPPPQLWMRLSGALQKKRNSELSYREIVKNSSNDETIAAKQVRLCGGGQGVGGGPSGRVSVCASRGFVFSVPFFSIS